ncbi:MAG TPA: glycoside hydrolase family 2 TIM barrel-domain containing protein [bacterium]|mgnify:FL=1|nr:glycoside hydrolase family 2 TIM barrel-domain containing protein [bacterium]
MSKLFNVVLLFLISGYCLIAAEFPLKDVCYNASMEISGNWLFKFDSSDLGIKEKWYEKNFDRSNWGKINVPGVWNKKPGEISYPCPETVGWYCCNVAIPATWKEEVLMVFLGSMYITDVWINGKYAGIHRAGYTPFMIDITKFIKPAEKTTIVVRVDNRRGKTIPSTGMGWHPFGGIYREVYLIHRGFVHLESIASSTQINGNQAVFKLTADVVNNSKTNYSGNITVQLKDKQKTAGSRTTYAQVPAGSRKKIIVSIPVQNAKLWSPDNPYLYTVNLTLPYRITQKVEFQTGLRQFLVKDGKFYLNGKRIWLQGFGNHEEYSGYGPCANEKLMKRDLLLMKNVFNANTIRTGHYPFHPLFFELCDKLGFIVHTEIPAWQVDKNFMQSDEAWNLWLKGQLEEMVSSFRNHACVAFWGLSNELYNVPLYHRKAYDFVHSLDPDRFITIVCASTADLESNKIADIVARNFHYGWYHSQSVYALRDNLPVVLRASEGKPIWVAEIGALANYEKYSGGYGDQSRGSETYQDKVVRYGVQYCATQTDQICGISVWTLSDFHGSNQFLPHGILDENRKPKILGYTICNLFNGSIRVYICEEDTMVKQGVYRASLRYFNPEEKNFQNLIAKWCIVKNQKKIASGSFNFSVRGTRQGEIGNIEFQTPEQSGLYSLWVELFDSNGNWLYTNSGFFDVKEVEIPGVLKVKTDKKHQNLKMIYQGIQIPVYDDIGLVLPFEQGKYQMYFRADGYKDIVYDIEITSGKATEISVRFEK